MRSSLVLITLAAGAAAQMTPLTCPTAEIPPASVHKSTTCEEEDLEAMPACRGLTGPGFCVDEGNACYGGADAGIRTDCSAPNYDAVYRVVGIDPAADGCCHPVG